jgi:hypothetical protein
MMLDCVLETDAIIATGATKMVCGDGANSIVVNRPGSYMVCLCDHSRRGECSNARHFDLAAGGAAATVAPIVVGGVAVDAYLGTMPLDAGSVQAPTILLAEHRIGAASYNKVAATIWPSATITEMSSCGATRKRCGAIRRTSSAYVP